MYISNIVYKIWMTEQITKRIYSKIQQFAQGSIKDRKIDAWLCEYIKFWINLMIIAATPKSSSFYWIHCTQTRFNSNDDIEVFWLYVND